jgi:hypothetical protein
VKNDEGENSETVLSERDGHWLKAILCVPPLGSPRSFDEEMRRRSVHRYRTKKCTQSLREVRVVPRKFYAFRPVGGMMGFFYF